MSTEAPVLLALDLTGTFAFALNGALTHSAPVLDLGFDLR